MVRYPEYIFGNGPPSLHRYSQELDADKDSVTAHEALMLALTPTNQDRSNPEDPGEVSNPDAGLPEESAETKTIFIDDYELRLIQPDLRGDQVL